MIQSILQTFEDKNYEYDIESLQIENELLRKNIERLEKNKGKQD